MFTNRIRSILAALTLAAAALVAPPAYACGGYSATPEERARWAVEAAVAHHFADRAPLVLERVDEVRVEGTQAHARVTFRAPNAPRARTQWLVLALRFDDSWAVVRAGRVRRAEV